MRPHLSLNVSDVGKSVEFYRRVFGIEPQKRTATYAKFDLPALNFSMQAGPASRVNHLGLEVGTLGELKAWEKKLIENGVSTRPEENSTCCYARQDKVWFRDPDGNAWEVFVVHEQLPTTAKTASGCCG